MFRLSFNVRRQAGARDASIFVHEGFDHGGRIFLLASPACADPQRKHASCNRLKPRLEKEILGAASVRRLAWPSLAASSSTTLSSSAPGAMRRRLPSPSSSSRDKERPGDPQSSSSEEVNAMNMASSSCASLSRLSSSSSTSAASSTPTSICPPDDVQSPPPAVSPPSWLSPWRRSSIAFCAESFVSWLLAVACLAVSGYYYLQGKLRYSRFVCPILTAGKDDGEDLRWTPWVPPLVTNSTGSGLGADEIDNTRLLFEQVVRLVAEHGTAEEERRERDDPMEQDSPLGSSESRGNESEGRESSTAGVKLAESRRDATNAGCQQSDDRLVSWVQADCGLRRAASDLVQALQRASPRDPTGRHLRRHSLCRQLRRVYPRLLELPSPPSDKFQYEISLIVPYYDPESAHSSKPIGSFLNLREKERGLRLQEERPAAETAARRLLEGTIEHARVGCDDPGSVELVVVHSRDDFDGDADGRQDAQCDEKDSVGAFLNGPPGASCNGASPSPRNSSDWGSVVLRAVGNRGRGPCLNEGARRASGRVLAFCHADAELPAGWDSSIRAAFGGGGGPSTNEGDAVLATAFQFGVDQEGAHSDRPPIPGLGAVVATANSRSRWFSLPYGDQCLGMRADVFRHLGGFPDLPLMEDYELVRCLRARELAARAGETRQRIVILPAQVRCSPRRWERHGVPFVTITNSRLVWAYQSGRAGAAEIYERYYGAPCGGGGGGGSASSRPPEREKD